MKYQPEYAASLLHQSYTFFNAVGKNTALPSYIEHMSFFFPANNTNVRTCLCVHAGGNISFPSPVRFTQTPLPYTVLLFVTDGEANISYNNTNLHLAKNDILLLPSDVELSFVSVYTPFTCAVFYLSGTSCEDFCPILFGDNTYYKKQHRADSILFRLLPSILEQLSSDESVAALHMFAMLNLTFSALVNDNAKEAAISALPKHVLRMKEIYDTDFKHPHSLDELEETIGINKYRLCRDFSKHIGISPVSYLTQVRLTEAKNLLRFSNMMVHEVGSAVGIENTTHFINLFKKNTGITPLQFRQNHSHSSSSDLN